MRLCRFTGRAVWSELPLRGQLSRCSCLFSVTPLHFWQRLVFSARALFERCLAYLFSTASVIFFCLNYFFSPLWVFFVYQMINKPSLPLRTQTFKRESVRWLQSHKCALTESTEQLNSCCLHLSFVCRDLLALFFQINCFTCRAKLLWGLNANASLMLGVSGSWLFAPFLRRKPLEMSTWRGSCIERWRQTSVKLFRWAVSSMKNTSNFVFARTYWFSKGGLVCTKTLIFSSCFIAFR